MPIPVRIIRRRRGRMIIIIIQGTDLLGFASSLSLSLPLSLSISLLLSLILCLSFSYPISLFFSYYNFKFSYLSSLSLLLISREDCPFLLFVALFALLLTRFSPLKATVRAFAKLHSENAKGERKEKIKIKKRQHGSLFVN